MRPVYIFGHKSPDTDSVCSAISLAYLKTVLGIKSIAKVIGPVNRETRFVLDYFGVSIPSYMNDVKVQIKDVKYLKKAFVKENDSLNNTFSVMKFFDLTAIPLVDNNNILKGYVTLKDMAKYLIEHNRDEVKTNIKHLLTTLDAKIVTNFRKEFEGKIQAVTFSSDTFIKEVSLSENDIVIVGDRYKVIEYAIKSKVQLIILTRNRSLPTKLLNKAVKNKVNIITSSYSSFELCNKVTLANYISLINGNENPKTLDIHSYYTDFLQLTKKYNFTNYPVVKNNNECLGVLRLTDSNNYLKKQVILVDHNNYEQSIEGIDEADILEIFDHHNIGNIGTNTPIYFTCRPVGCTATIIYDNYKKERVEVPESIAGLLLSAIISDTLLLSSPTTTSLDIKYAEELANIAKVDIKEYGMQMLKAASSIKGLSVTELINQDFKTYSINDKIYGIAVITSMDFDEIEKNIPEYVAKLNEMSYNQFKAVLIFITDVIKQGSYVLYNDASKELVEDSFGITDLYEGYFIKDLISRKKQILPAILKTLEK